jgi:hypothetical protein
LSEDIVNKIEKKGIESLGEGEKNDYMLNSIHKVCLVIKYVLFLQRTAEIIHKYIVDLIKYLKENETITFIDYKENIILPIGPVETQAGWFHKANVTILGFLTIYGEKDKQSKKLIRTVLSDNLNHDALFTDFCLKEVFSLILINLFISVLF